MRYRLPLEEPTLSALARIVVKGYLDALQAIEGGRALHEIIEAEGLDSVTFDIVSTTPQPQQIGDPGEALQDEQTFGMYWRAEVRQEVSRVATASLKKRRRRSLQVVKETSTKSA